MGKDGDGFLDDDELPSLFLPETEEGVQESEISGEEHSDFHKLDLDADGFIDVGELSVWESGRFHTEDAMKNLIEIADKDHDLHISAEELAAAREEIAASHAHYHLVE